MGRADGLERLYCNELGIRFIEYKWGGVFAHIISYEFLNNAGVTSNHNISAI